MNVSLDRQQKLDGDYDISTDWTIIRSLTWGWRLSWLDANIKCGMSWLDYDMKNDSEKSNTNLEEMRKRGKSEMIRRKRYKAIEKKK